MNIQNKTKLVASNLGNARKGGLVGYVYGVANGLKDETLPTGDFVTAIMGSFEGRSGDGQKIIRSGRLLLPTGVHDDLVKQLRNADGTVKSLRFAYALSTTKQENGPPRWGVGQIVAPAPDDALSRLSTEVDASIAKANAPAPVTPPANNETRKKAAA